MAVKGTLHFCQEGSSHIESWLRACEIPAVFMEGEGDGDTLTVIVMAPSAECTGLGTMAFTTCLSFFSLDSLFLHLSSCVLLELGLTFKRSVKDETLCFQYD